MSTLSGIGLSAEWGIVALAGVALAAAACVDVFRNADLTGGTQVMWVAIVLVLPIFGPAIYFGVRGDW
jgi:hypothetical protein